MDFEKIKNTIKEIQLSELRQDGDNYFEAVTVKEEINKLTAQLESFFGTPVFPSKDKLSLQINQDITAFGGIMPGQTLYYWAQGSDILFAMLWPWQDGQHITIKLIKK